MYHLRYVLRSGLFVEEGRLEVRRGLVEEEVVEALELELELGGGGGVVWSGDGALVVPVGTLVLKEIVVVC